MINESNLNFYGLGIIPKLLDTLEKLKFKHPTPIQSRVIPSAIEGKDVIGIAQTGTGKTLAFGIPLIQRLANLQGRALVLTPTRELAIQVEENILKISRAVGIKTAVLIGGDSAFKQVKHLEGGARVIIATPGRLIDLMNQRKVHLNDIHILVLDEADRMLDMGFAPQVDKILKVIPTQRQTMLFSATMPSAIIKMTSKHMKTPTQVEVAPAGTTAQGVTHELFIVRRENKKELLKKILEQYRGPVLLFCRTKSGTTKTVRTIIEMGHRAACMHSDRSLEQRKKALEGFKLGKYRILAATDIASRGIDVAGIELVINYDLPDDAENYVHRIGRTGRAGATGHAISFASPEQHADVLKIEQLTKIALPISKHSDITSANFEKSKNVFSYSKTAAQRRGRFPRRRR